MKTLIIRLINGLDSAGSWLGIHGLQNTKGVKAGMSASNEGVRIHDAAAKWVSKGVAG